VLLQDQSADRWVEYVCAGEGDVLDHDGGRLLHEGVGVVRNPDQPSRVVLRQVRQKNRPQLHDDSRGPLLPQLPQQVQQLVPQIRRSDQRCCL